MKKKLATIILSAIIIASWIIDSELFTLVAVFALRVIISSICVCFLFLLMIYKPDDNSLTQNNYGPELSDKYIGGDGLY